MIGQIGIRATGAFAALWLSLTSPLAAETAPVVVELYTSQGCSSCPPADDYFHRELAGREDVIALAFHVDYWDYIGWKDIHADPAYTQRQHSYARAAGHRSVYTPQMIVNGKDHVVGAHPGKVEGLIKTHKKNTASVDLSIARDGNQLRIKATATQPKPMQVHVIRYKQAEKVSIKRGENAGRVLTYANIVSEWTTVKDWNGRSAFSTNVRVKGDAPIVVLIQRENGGPIETAARIK
ncbi:DUF1223 domain-containing protein [Shimia sagamensis]|uniref:Secreted protein n=1 Tax=Shimia sagamensis TaxID=1566352 RepID=A0ABY1PK11_9RHOB|nr:DUF1223 domain-containing protein [Shimia sagamensis]SMP35185.1 hypothetical protein SAMN06265373_11124 [Shimia sagamensis]